MYEYLVRCDLKDRRVLVVGCGFGDDALRIAKLGAKVNAFDLSPDSLEIARSLASREGLDIVFEEQLAENLQYDDSTFDYVVCRDILHHVDIPRAMGEIARVAKPGAVFVVNEIYSHSFTDKIRYSAFVDKFLYPRMKRIVYGSDKPYITEDERKLNEFDVAEIKRFLNPCLCTKYFHFLVTRVISNRFVTIAKLDRLVLRVLHPIAYLLAGRILFIASIDKTASSSAQ
jgi:ubiquinone/menaquinone biosynthesis C-methylase UbiE